MSTDSASPESADPDERDVRAATEAMVVVREAPGMYRVYSGETSVYTVDAVGPACECGDFRFRHDQHGRACKHVRRVEMVVGARDIPDGIDPDPVLELQRAKETSDP